MGFMFGFGAKLNFPKVENFRKGSPRARGVSWFLG